MTAQEKAEIDTIGGRKFATVEPLTNYFIGRVQKDINNGNTIVGGIFTSTNRELDADVSNILHKAAYTGGIDFTQYFKNKNWMFNLNTAFSLVQGSKEAITNTQESSAHYFQRPDKNYAILDTNRTSLSRCWRKNADNETKRPLEFSGCGFMENTRLRNQRPGLYARNRSDTICPLGRI